MKIGCFSDNHGHLPEIEPCDILVIAGDICIDRDPPQEVILETQEECDLAYRQTGQRLVVGDKVYLEDRCGSPAALGAQSRWLYGPFADWLDRIPAKHVVACWGNHDYIGERRPDLVPKSLRWHILTDEGVTIDGVKIWGCPWQPFFYNWSFNAPPEDDGTHGPRGEAFIADKLSRMPGDTDILICHGPPAGYGDVAPDGRPTGSKALLEAIKRVKPVLSVHGHIHRGRGQWEIERDNMAPGHIVNACAVNERYRLVHKPFYLDLAIK